MWYNDDIAVITRIYLDLYVIISLYSLLNSVLIMSVYVAFLLQIFNQVGHATSDNNVLQSTS